MTLPSSFDIADLKLREHIEPRDRSRIFEFLNTDGFFYPREMAYGMDMFDELLRRGENNTYQLILVEQGNKLVACACYGLLPLTDQRYHLHWFVVAKSYQGHGVGHLLEATIVEKVRVQGGVRIYAETSNRDYHAGARKFYEQCGYRQGAVIPDYFRPGDDRVLYVKDL